MTRVRVALGAVVVGFVAGAALVGGWVAREERAARRLSVVAVAPTAGGPHLALPGRPVQLKAILAPLRPGRLLRYRWEFGDGQGTSERPVTDPYAVDASHVYVGPAGARFEARLRVVDAQTGEEGEARYPVELVAPSLDALNAACLDEGLWALHRSMLRAEDPLHGAVGRWRAQAGHDAGVTAMGTLAFLVNGFDLRPERAGHPYTDTVERGLRFLATQLVEVPAPAGLDASVADLDGDGRFLTVVGGRRMYETPLVALALVGTQAPDRPLGGANPTVSGRPLREVVRDLLDYVLLAQCDARARDAAGGWRYDLAETSSDMSVVQWPALALHGAEALWGLRTPASTKERLAGYLQRAQGPDGGFGYGIGDSPSVRLTGAGLIALACAGADARDPRVEGAREFIAARWGDGGNVGDDYAMYAVMKGATLLGISRLGEHDWRREYVLRLARTQGGDGAWPADGAYGQGALATAWPCLILAQDVFCSAAPVTAEALRWQVIAGAGALVGAGLLLRLLRLLRRQVR